LSGSEQDELISSQALLPKLNFNCNSDDFDFSPDEENLSKKTLEIIHSKDTELLNTKNELAIYKTDSHKKINDLLIEVQGLRSLEKKYQLEFDSKSERLQSLESQHQFDREQIEELRQQRVLLEKEIHELSFTTNQLNQLVHSIENNKNGELKALKNSYEQQIGHLKKLLSSEQIDILNLKSENFKLDIDIKQAMSELTSTRLQMKYLEKEFETQSSKYLKMIEVKSSDIVSENKIKELNVLVESHLSEATRLKLENSKLRKQLQMLEEKLFFREEKIKNNEDQSQSEQKEKLDIQRLHKSFNLELLQFKNQSNNEIEQLKKTITNIENIKANEQNSFRFERENFAFQKSKLEKEIEFLNQSLNLSRLKDSETSQNFQKMNTEIQNLKGTLDHKVRNIEMLTLRNEELANDSLELKSCKKSLEMAQNEVYQANLKIEVNTRRIQDLEAENDKYKLLIESFRFETDRISQNIDQEKSKNAERLSLLEESNAILEKKLAQDQETFQQTINQMDLLQGSLVNQLKEKIHQYEHLQIQFNEKLLLLHSFKERNAELGKIKFNLEKTVEEKENVIKQLSNENKVLSHQMKDLKESFEKEDERVSKELIIIENRLSILSQQEFRLENYNKALNRKKNEMVLHFEFLLGEYNFFEKAHPLQDYLKMTESELNRLEVQLRKTPTISIDRSRLEQAFKELVEQRNQINEIIDNRKKDLSKKINELRHVLEKSKAEFLPPPPPRSLLSK